MLALLADVVGGVIEPGDYLPSETELLEQFDVSRLVIREAMRGLEERGLVRVKHGRGALVVERDEWNVLDPDVLSALLSGPEGPDVLEEYVEARVILEVAAAGLAAGRARESDISSLRAAYAEMERTATRAARNPSEEPAYHDADIFFHTVVLRASHNRALAHMLDPLQKTVRAREPLARPHRRVEVSLPEHKAILEAITARDPEGARQAMATHLATVQEYLAEFANQQKAARAEGTSV